MKRSLRFAASLAASLILALLVFTSAAEDGVTTDGEAYEETVETPEAVRDTEAPETEDATEADETPEADEVPIAEDAPEIILYKAPASNSKYVLSPEFKKAEFIVGSSWTALPHSGDVDHIEGLRLTTASSSYRLEYRVKPRGYDWTSLQNSGKSGSGAGLAGVPVTNIEIKVYSNVKCGYDKTDYVVMYRAKAGGVWLGWVSNGTEDVMTAVKSEFSLGGELDVSATDAGWEYYGNITALEIMVFQKRNHTAGSSAVLIDAPYINQYASSLPNGCESVSAAMALQHAGLNITAESFVKNYLPKGSAPVYGVGADPAEVYVGDPHLTDGGGWGCYAPVIVKALKSATAGKGYTVTNLTGSELSVLCRDYIDRGVPVIVWATTGMTGNVSYSWWQTPGGKSIKYNNRLHTLLLVGYDANYYYFNDPMTRIGSEKYFAYSKSETAAAYATLGKGAAAVEKTYCKSIKVTSPPARTVYVAGDEIDLTGIAATAYFSDGTSARVTSLTPSESTAKQGATSVTVLYTKDGVTVSAEVPVKVYDKIVGDADGDGDVTAKDVLLCRKIIAGLEDISSALLSNADCNGDGDVTAKDVLIIRRIVVGLDV